MFHDRNRGEMFIFSVLLQLLMLLICPVIGQISKSMGFPTGLTIQVAF